MPDTRIEVTVYAGYRGAQRPQSFLFEGTNVRVREIVRMWVEEERATRAQRRFFVVNGDDNREYTIYCRLESEEWFMRKREQDNSK